MNLPKQVYDGLKKKFAGDFEGFAAAVEKCSEIIASLSSHRGKLLKLDKEYREAASVLQKAEAVLQGECPHYVVTHHYDPADSSDNYTRCTICSKTFSGGQYYRMYNKCRS